MRQPSAPDSPPRVRPSPRARPSSARAAVLVLLALVAATVAPVATAEAPTSYQVIVAPTSGVVALDRRFLSDVFLKKATRWPNGDNIFPVDLGPTSRIRARFSDEVVGRSLAAVRSYWQQIIFAGRGLPPPELADDAAVVRYVLGHPGAIGYVSTDADLGGARIVTVNR